MPSLSIGLKFYCSFTLAIRPLWGINNRKSSGFAEGYLLNWIRILKGGEINMIAGQIISSFWWNPKEQAPEWWKAWHPVFGLEGGLGLPVNKEKSKVAPIKEVEFFGFQILRGKLRVSNGAREKFKSKVRKLTKRNNPLSMRQVILVLNEYLAGWMAYYRSQEFRQIFRHLDDWLRSRLCSIQLKKWKNSAKFQRIMIWAGYESAEARKT